MNERPNLGSRQSGLNAQLWVRAATPLTAALDQLKTFSVVDVSVGFC